MKRRMFITSALALAPAAALAPLIKLDGVPIETKQSAPKYVVGNNQLTDYELSSDVNDFDITIDTASKLIDIRPYYKLKPHLTVLALHRHLADLSDRAWSKSDVIDITSDVVTERATNEIIYVVNGWRTTQSAKEVLVGGIVEGDVQYATLKIIGEVDYNLTRNIEVAHNGIRYPYHKAGYARIPLHGYTGATSTSPNLVTVSYDAYMNTHSVLNEETMELDIVRGVWSPTIWHAQPTLGVTMIPIFSMG